MRQVHSVGKTSTKTVMKKKKLLKESTVSSKMDKKLIKIVVYGLNHHEFVTAVRYGFDILIVSFLHLKNHLHSSSLCHLSCHLYTYTDRLNKTHTYTLLRLQSKERNEDRN